MYRAGPGEWLRPGRAAHILTAISSVARAAVASAEHSAPGAGYIQRDGHSLITAKMTDHHSPVCAALRGQI